MSERRRYQGPTCIGCLFKHFSNPHFLQPDCVAAINRLIDEFNPPGLVVCCRLNEYRWLPERLKLNGAIYLEPLSKDEVAEYFTRGGPKLAALSEPVNTDPVLQDLAQTPLSFVLLLASQLLLAIWFASRTLFQVRPCFSPIIRVCSRAAF